MSTDANDIYAAVPTTPLANVQAAKLTLELSPEAITALTAVRLGEIATHLSVIAANLSRIGMDGASPYQPIHVKVQT